ncbi:MAG: biotin transporter BioY [Oscillospiraceae bacterium]|nr:biotin transporter BioY [Oscillospiraceae bacterium]
MAVRKMTAAALGAVLIIICSWLTVPFAVPFTMQTFAVFCVLILLGGKLGTASIGLFVLMGLVGLPVFSGFRGGVGVLLGPTGGYIIGFIFAGLLYMMLEPAAEKSKWIRAAVLAGGLALCYAVGTLWFLVVARRGGTDYGLGKVLAICVLPYILPDLAKLWLAMFVGGRLKGKIKLP